MRVCFALADVRLAVTTEISSLSKRKLICVVFRNMLSSLSHKQINGGETRNVARN